MSIAKPQIMHLANELTDWCVKNHFGDVVIYYWDMRNLIDYNGKVVIEDYVNVDDYLEYHGDILSMSFEGDLYDIFNYSYGSFSDSVIEEFNSIIEKYGLYFEQGNAWNLSLYE